MGLLVVVDGGCMARFTGGWIKLHRSVSDHWIGNDGWSLAIFCKLLMWANREPTKLIRQGHLITIERGQVLTSTAELAAKLKFERKTVERRLDLLAKDGTIVQQVSNRGRIITICNYEDYQKNDKDTVQQKSSERPPEGTTPYTPAGTPAGTRNGEVKNLKKKRSKEFLTEKVPTPANAVVFVEENPTNKFIAHYCEVYKAKYTTAPVIDGRTAGIAKNLVTGNNAISIPRAKILLESYLRMNDQWFLTKKHDLYTFQQNLNAIELFTQTGKQITQSQAKQVEVADQNRSVIDNYFREKGAL